MLAVSSLHPDEWDRLRAIRLRALESNPEAFGGSADSEPQWTSSQWREQLLRATFLVVTSDDEDMAMMSLENLDGDFGATCWIGGCWTDPAARGRGCLSTMLSYVDHHAVDGGWTRQGLGVWVHNEVAIAAYNNLGFVVHGEPVPSTSHPGWFYQRMLRDAPTRTPK